MLVYWKQNLGKLMKQTERCPGHCLQLEACGQWVFLVPFEDAGFPKCTDGPIIKDQLFELVGVFICSASYSVDLNICFYASMTNTAFVTTAL